MSKRIVYAVIFFLAMCVVVPRGYAEESSLYQKVKVVVDTLDPQVEELYSFDTHEWLHGASVALYKLNVHQLPLASLRGGYGFDQDPIEDTSHELIYGSVKLDLPSVAVLLTPEAVESYFQGGVLGRTTEILGKYAAVGLYGGRDLQTDRWDAGLTAGFRITW